MPGNGPWQAGSARVPFGGQLVRRRPFRAPAVWLVGPGAILGCLLFDLMAEVIELGLGVAGLIDLLGGVEDGDEVAGVHFGPIGDELREGHGAALAEDLGDEDLGRMDGFDDAGDADFAFYSRGIGGSGVGDRGRGTRAGGEEEKEGGNRQG